MAMRIKCPVVPGPGAGCPRLVTGRMFRELVAGAGLERRDLEVSRNKPGGEKNAGYPWSGATGSPGNNALLEPGGHF